jgi:hypothetical protein
MTKYGESQPVAGRQRQPVLRLEDELAVHEYFESWARQLQRFREPGEPGSITVDRGDVEDATQGGAVRRPGQPSATAGWRAWEAALEVPVEAMKRAALLHKNPKVRRECLNVLDHAASDASVGVFRRALGDPVPRVRLVALHGLACERCRVGQLCVEDVVTDLVHTVSTDPSAKVRHAAVLVLARFVDRDQRARAALASAAMADTDQLVRAAARATSRDAVSRVPSRKALRRRQARPPYRSYVTPDVGPDVRPGHPCPAPPGPGETGKEDRASKRTVREKKPCE